ncbi:MAG: DUF6588 family protein [Flavobacteriaceae bacterium]
MKIKVFAIKMILVFGVVFSTQLKAQSIDNLIAAGKDDASIYLGNYMQPAFKGLIYNMNNGWYHTGKVHKKYGFDLSVNVSASFVSDTDKTFSFKNSDYNVLELNGSSTSADLPTVMGQTSTQQINVKIPIDLLGNPVPLGIHVGFKIYDFETINGVEQDLIDATGYAAVPSPMIQFGIGLPSKTDLKLRFTPKISSGDVKFNMFGFGLQHDLMQYFRKEDSDKKSKFDLSILGAYTSLKTVYTPANTSIATNQEATIKIDSYTAQVIGNINFKIIDLYGGFGYTAGNSSFNVNGDFTHSFDIVNIGGLITNTVTETISDPIAISHSLSGMKSTIGMRINLAFFKIYADYNFQEYNTANAGIAFSFK